MEVFIQGEGLNGIELVVLGENATVADLIKAVKVLGFPADVDDLYLSIEGEDDVVHHTYGKHSHPISHCGIGHHKRVHVHRKRRVEVTVHYGVQTATHTFSPATTVGRVLAWAVQVKEFKLDHSQAAEHKLQLCNSVVVPDSDIHIGALATEPHGDKRDHAPGCSKGQHEHTVALCFNLIVKHRPQG